jgi:hypothetical protein
MKHPSRSTLALHAGGDLSPWAKWRTGRHVVKCEECRAEVAAFGAVRKILPDLSAIPEVPWNRLAAAMKANIRRELADAKSMWDAPRYARPFGWARAATAFAGVAALVAAGLVLEQARPPAVFAEGVELQSMANGIQVRDRGGALGLLDNGAVARDVNYTAGAQGSMRAQNVDSETGYVTVTNVYAN